MTKKSLMIFGLVLFVFAVVGFTNATSDVYGLKINEFISNPYEGTDWVEVYSFSDNVDLSLCKLVDAGENELALFGIINSGEFMAFDWSNRLNNGGDTISLICSEEIIDEVVYGSSTGNAPIPSQGESAGRCPNGEDTNYDYEDFELFYIPSKGYENYCEEYENLCGNGELNGEESCDLGEENGLQCSTEYGESCSFCNNFCELETINGGFCGDEIINGNEKCDDGNTESGDGCSKSCRIESSDQTGGSVGTGVGVDIETEDYVPNVWMCDNRYVLDDNVEPGRWGNCKGDQNCILYERFHNYAFEGEQIHWIVLVKDKNGINKIEDVFATLGSEQGAGNDIESNCVYLGELPYSRELFPNCNARIGEEELTYQNYLDEIGTTMGAYECTLTVETPESMYGEYWVTVEAVDLDGLSGTMDENEYWFFNPEIALDIDGDLMFGDVRPGTSSYSRTITVGNDADDGSGVMLDMFISGTDFYDSSSSGAMCPTSNVLELDNFRYFATHGAYSTLNDFRKDVEGYVPINYGIEFMPNLFYDQYEMLQSGPKEGLYYKPNILSPGDEMALTFRLDLPEPCNGDFDTGQIYFWGEAI